MSDLREQLGSAVGSSFKIGDELGGGGMSRVFVAEDTALGRTVVVKVLHPELAAGVNVERFKREVQLAARLQHPHIVPVLSAGEVDGLPYYVMPFVKGESLATKLARGPLPVAEVVHVMGDVAKALAYAQSEGVVHRDIKPDNILVSGGAAAVADFGIAKALSAASRGTQRPEGDPSHDNLTTVGTSLGTAGYMAPEQVAGDPSLDHRADIYALGCVAYELLTGASPFAGKSPQQMLAAHVLEQPVPVQDKRRDTPPALAELVMRCMAKDPADRPQSGEEILAALDGISLGTTGQHAQVGKPRSRVGFAVAAGAAFAAAMLTALVVSRGHKPKNESGVLLAVAPFEVLDPNLNLWKEGLVDVLSRNLDGGAGLHTVSPSAAIKRWEGHVGRDEAAAFAKRTGAQIVVYGSLRSAGRDSVDGAVWILDTRSSGNPVELHVRDSSSRMDRVSDSLSVKLLSAIGGERSVGSVRSLGSGSLPAIKAFLQGMQRFRHTDFDSAAVSFREAIALDSSFAIAHAFLNQTLGWTGGATDERIREAALGGRHLRGGLSPLDSLTIAAISQYWDTTGGSEKNHKAAYGTLATTTQRYPNDALSWYLLGDFRYHRDPEFSDQEALRDFGHAIEADSDFVPSYIHAVEISARYGPDVQSRYLRPYVARASTDHDARGKRLAMQLAAKGGTTDPQLRTLIDTGNSSVVGAAFSALTRMPDSAEAAIYVLRQVLKRADAKNNRALPLQLIGSLAARGHVKEAWDGALAEKDFAAGEIALLGLVPADSAARAMRTWLDSPQQASAAALPALAAAHDTATLLAASERLSKALAAIKPGAPGPSKTTFQYFTAALHGYLQLARGDSAGALKVFDSIPAFSFNVPTDQYIRARLIARTDPKRALALMEGKQFQGDILSVARELEIGRLAERANDVPRAVEAYTYVAGAWQNTDNDQLRNAVRESRDALKRLDSDGRLRAQFGPH